MELRPDDRLTTSNASRITVPGVVDVPIERANEFRILTTVNQSL